MSTDLTRRSFLQAATFLGLTGRCWSQAPEEPPLPALRPAERLDGPPLVSARAWTIAEGRTGRVLWGSQEGTALAMASTTKIMTAHLVLQLASANAKVLEETVVVSEQAAKTGGSTARIQTGDRVSVRDLLYGLMLPSGNDAATAFAEHFGARVRTDQKATPVAAFVARMNQEAAKLRMGETRYFDPHGLGKNQTSARNLATLAHQAMQDAQFRQFVQARRHRCDLTDAKGQKRAVVWNNTNKLLEMEGYDGVKTGTTTAAGFCLVGSGRHLDDHLYVVILGATSNDSRYLDARNLFRWAWQQRQKRP